MSDLFDRILMLKRTPVFSAVYTEDLRVVAQILEEEAYFAGEHVFDINDPSNRFYIIEEGRIGISIHPEPNKNEFVAVLGPKDCFGEMGIFDDQPRSATAHVIEDCTLLSLEKTKLRNVLISYPELALGLLHTLSTRLRQANLKLGVGG